jgi:hypothetical protein
LDSMLVCEFLVTIIHIHIHIHIHTIYIHTMIRTSKARYRFVI